MEHRERLQILCCDFAFSNLIAMVLFSYYPLYFKANFSVHKLIAQNDQMTTLYTNRLLYITFTMLIYIRHE